MSMPDGPPDRPGESMERQTTPPAIGPAGEWHYEELDRLSQVLQRPVPLADFLDEVLATVREMVGAEAAWLLRDVAVDAPAVTVVAESIEARYAGATGMPQQVLDDQARDLLSRALVGRGPATMAFDRPAERGPVARKFDVVSQMAAAIRPDGELPWIIGLDRKIAPGAWTTAERRLFGAAADRIGQALVQRLLVERLQGELDARRRAEQAFSEKQQQLERLINASPDIICFKDGAGRWLLANEADLRLFELEGVAYQGRLDSELADFTHPRFREAFLNCEASDEAAWTAGTTVRAEERIPGPDGEVLLDVIKVPAFAPDGRREGLVVIGRDVTAWRAAESGSRVAAAAMEHGGEAFVVLDHEGRITQVNRAYERIFSRPRQGVLGTLAGPESGLPADIGSRVALAARGGPWSGEVRCQRADGSAITAWLTVSAVPDGAGQVRHWVIVVADIGRLRDSEAALEHMARHDPLTGLLNRHGFESMLAERLAGGPIPLEVLVFDLDGFKRINDSLGHAAGDAVLVQMADRLRRVVGPSGHVARIGGDDFAVVVDARPALRPERWHARIMELTGAPVQVDGTDLVVSWCVGCAHCPQDAAEAGALVRCATAAANRAKASGPGVLRRFAPTMTAAAAERIEMERGLRRLVAAGGPSVAYQPIVDPRRSAVVGFEALARWVPTGRAPIPPARFIPLAEESGLIVALGDNVLRQACHQAAAWRAAGHAVDFVSVNVSGRQLDDEGFFERVAAHLTAADLPPQALELEVTESVLMGRPDQALGTLNALRALGVRLAIDDFGTGYSSLAHLKRLPVNKLKLDRSFVAELPQDAHDAAIARAVMALGRSLDFTVVAEGVETAEQLAFLRSLGCDLIQGFHYGQPLAAERISFSAASD
ncbi:MAG: EAL domain-containing protein [Myxococcales bacterium]|nr:EAL domain-containing protein [Myxococcales bacterium]